MMFFKKPLPFVLFLLLLQHTQNNAFAQYFTGSVSGALGGSGMAANDAGEETFLNPAGIAHAPVFTIGTFYRDGYSGDHEHQTFLGANLVDNNKEALFPGSFAYLQARRTFDGPKTVDEEYFQASLGNFLFRQVALGVSLIYLVSEQVNGSRYKQWNAVIGLHWNPIPDLGLALVHYNVAQAKENVPDYLELIPKTGLGVTYIFSRFFRTRLDIKRQWKQNSGEELDISGGFETITNNFIILRMGGQSDEANQRNFFTAGLGFTGPKFQINYAYKKNINGISGALHSVDLLIPF